MSKAERATLAAAFLCVVSGTSIAVAGRVLDGVLIAGISALWAAQVWVTACYHAMFLTQRRAADDLGEQLMAELRKPTRL